jgi:hypothetical protein
MEHTILNPLPPEPSESVGRADFLHPKPNAKRLALVTLVIAGESLSGIMTVTIFVVGILLFFGSRDDHADGFARILVPLGMILGWLVAFLWITVSVTLASLATVGAKSIRQPNLVWLGRATYSVAVASYVFVIWPLIKLAANR